MRFQRPLFGFLFFCATLSIPFSASASYQVAPSTGSGLPYSVEAKNLLKHIYNNRTVVGGQVIALKDQPGKNYSGNYIDVGDLGGVKTGDVFALFTPKGEPVGFIKIVETQHYTSSFDFIELTVDPSDNLSAKKITDEVRGRLPDGLLIYPDMKRFKKGTQFAYRKQKPLPPSLNASAQSSLPPLPGESPAATTASTLPPLPSENSQVSGGSSLPPLPMDTSSSLSPAPAGSELPALPSGADSTGLPPLSPDNSAPGAGLPPLGTDSSAPPLPAPDNGSSGLPALPADNNPAPGSLPPLSNDSGLPPLSTTAPDSGMPALPADNSGAMPALPPPSPGGADSGAPPLPGEDSSMPALPPDNSQALPPLGTAPSSDMSLPPIPNGEPANNGSPMMPPQSQLPSSDLPPMDNNGGLPQASSVLPALDSGLPPLPDAGTPQPPLMAQAPSADTSLPPLDNGAAPAALNGDIPLPPMDSASLPPSTDMSLPPVADASLPPAVPRCFAGSRDAASSNG